ncbi:mismatch repair endonuclease PMS2-like isoform X2 [Ptychodera flava]|uniref:mismatch repair endonuclease PMS2-like isoform X2 n=1 Tax=Ptychodera flava TaxID=63121 RepID=UPI00396A7A00
MAERGEQLEQGEHRLHEDSSELLDDVDIGPQLECGGPPTNMKAGHVQAIDKQSVHQICSGQVVLNLATAVKELVENSLDAGATNIDIRLKEHGSEFLEVADNGSGVEPRDFEGLALKHHTSKLRDFSDLTSVGTFGFRGEALSSLCALCDLSVITCHKSSSIGTRLEYDHNGKISKKEACPRQEYTKMVNVLYAYCIISTGVRIQCTNQNGKGKKVAVVSTNGNSTMKENITNIFGPKQIQSLLDFEQHVPSEQVCEDYGLKADKVNAVFRISGLVSKPDHGLGRSSTDRQFYFINNRPCDYSKVSKVVNEVYHMYNRHQYPFVVMDISLAKEGVDVNVTPDKRQILLQEEKTLLAIIKTSLMKMYEPRSSVYAINQKPSALVKSASLSAMFGRGQSNSSSSNGSPNKRTKVEPAIQTLTLSRLKRAFSHPGSTTNLEEVDSYRKPAKQPRLDSFVFRSPHSSSSQQMTQCQDADSEGYGTSSISSNSQDISQGSSTDLDIVQNSPSCADCSSSLSSQSRMVENQESSTQAMLNRPFLKLTNQSHPSRQSTNQSEPSSQLTNKRDQTDESTNPQCILSEISNINNSNNTDILTETAEHTAMIQNTHDQDTELKDRTEEDRTEFNVYCEDVKVKKTLPNINSLPCKTYRKASSSSRKIDKEVEIQRKEVTIPFCLTNLQKKLKRVAETKSESEVEARSFRAKISPGDNATAEEELQREISKDMFSKMEILGQFNLGFIIAKLKQDLFIIDQHATDEKYNFEMLQKHTTLQSQRLIQAKNLELTSVNECVLMDNIEIFRKNGFDFLIDEEAEPTQRVKLLSLPMSKNWTFGKEDIDELIFMLSDAPGVTCRPSRVRQMFASRSCRKSVMIGTALNKAEMSKLVYHMGEIEQPWNCPHGRPTMRHLFNLNMLPD